MMIVSSKPSKDWKLLTEKELNNMFVRAEASMGWTPAVYLFFLTEGSVDYLVWEGEVYAKNN